MAGKLKNFNSLSTEDGNTKSAKFVTTSTS